MRNDPEVAWTKARGVLAHFRSGVSSEQLVREIREGRDMSTPDNDAATVERWWTDDDVERVAVDLFDVLDKDDDASPVTHHRYCLRVARAALAAMPERGSGGAGGGCDWL
jgi:hypothetical protein